MAITKDLKSPYDYTTDDYKAILLGNTDLHSERPGKTAIIGAGISGLIAASLLKRSGHNVTIFEAKHVVGGRVKTLRERFTNGFYAEAGAMRVPSHHELTNMLIAEFNLETFEFVNESKAGLIYINEHRPTYQDYENNPTIFNTLLFNEKKDWLTTREARDRHERDWLTAEEKALTAEELFNICIENHIRTEHKWPEFEYRMLWPKDKAFLPPDKLYSVMEEFDKYSLRQFLAGKAEFNGRSLTRSAQNMICSILSHEMQMSSSMAAVLCQYVMFHAAAYKQIKYGMDRLPKAFLATSGGGLALPGLDESICYNSRVIGVEDTGPHLLVRTRNTITSAELVHEEFNRVIMCIPFAAIRHIEMQDLTSESKRRAIRQIHYSNACKILLEFRHKFWEDALTNRPSIKGGHSITDLPIRNIYYPTPDQNQNRSGGGLLLASYTWGEDSLRWTSLKPDDRIRFALRDLARVHGIAGLEKSCIGGMSHSWAEDEFTAGAFAHFEPSQLTDLFTDLWRPENNIHYAGEHTSTKHAWIEGAVESGIRVAKEVCDSLTGA